MQQTLTSQRASQSLLTINAFCSKADQPLIQHALSTRRNDHRLFEQRKATSLASTSVYFLFHRRSPR